MEKDSAKTVIWVSVGTAALVAIICAFVIGLSLGNGGGAAQEDNEYAAFYKVTADTVLYSEAIDISDVIKEVESGDVVAFLGVGENDFYMVQHESDYGYIKKQYLKETEVMEEKAEFDEMPAMADDVKYEMYVVNCQRSVSLRTNPSMKAKVITSIGKGERVGYVSAAQNGYVRVVYRGQGGYVLGSYLSYQNQPSDVIIKKTMYVVNCKTDISLRSEPSASAGVMLTIPLHDPVGYIESVGNGFAKVSYRGIIGYASENYLTDTLIAMEEEPSKTLYVINCNESITLRNAPSRSAGEIMQIPLGEAVGYIGSAYNGFAKVKYMGRTGYALSSYLGDTPQEKAKDAQPSKTLYVVNCSKSITLRNAPSQSAGEMMQIPFGEAVGYIESAGNGFAKVQYMGRTGYVLSSYLGDTPQEKSNETPPPEPAADEDTDYEYYEPQPLEPDDDYYEAQDDEPSGEDYAPDDEPSDDGE